MPATNDGPIYMILGAGLQTGQFWIGVIVDMDLDPFLSNGFDSLIDSNPEPMLSVLDPVSMRGSRSESRTGSN